jgi:hypothetical protein
MALISRKRLLSLIALACLAATVVAGARPATTATTDVQGAQVVLGTAELAGWENDGGTIEEGALTLAAGETTALFTSPAIAAPLPFNAIVASWGPRPAEGDESVLALYVRTATNSGGWGEWQEVHPSADLTLPEDELVTGDFIMLPAQTGRHEQVQLRAQLYAAPDGAMPRLEQVEISFIDSTAGPTAEEAFARAQAQPQPAAAESGYPKPFVVSRADWCWDTKCNYSDGLSYHPVTHLILHHTVSGGGMDSASAMRAIWYFHTVTRGWGDIGYNYLVDANGVIYEGHLGGDDVVGTHSGDANTGSMALSMIGDYTSIAPSEAMRNAAANLFAWKADQKGIDVYDASRPPNMSWGLPHLSGHRDVYGTTACPGDSGHPWLPWLRDQVAQRIGFTPQHLYFDELDPATHFSRSASGWNSTAAIRNCGIDGHAWYTWSTTDPAASTNWGEWRPEIPWPGRYELSVFAPYCYTKKGDTDGARYEINHAGGTSSVTISQGDRLGLWTSLGQYSLYAGTSNRLRLTDLTSTDSGYGVWFDAIRVRYINPAAVLQTPTAGTTTNPVHFAWSVTTPESLTSQRLQLAIDPAFQNVILDTPLGAGERSADRSVSHPGGVLYWRIRLISTRGETLDTPPKSFTLINDTTPPSSSITAVYLYPNGDFGVAWRGQDDAAGVSSYNVDYRLSGTATWTRWLTATPGHGGYFRPPQPGGAYWFRSQAIDAAGNVEPLHTGDGDANTTEAIILTDHHFLAVLPR